METWFSCKISYPKQLDNGMVTSKTETYLLNAVTFTEAEARLQALLEEYIPNFQLSACNKVKITGVVIDEAKEKFYKVKLAFEAFDEDGGKLKKMIENHVVQANSLKEAYTKVEERMKGSVIEWDISAVTEFNIVDIFPYESGEALAAAQPKGVTEEE